MGLNISRFFYDSIKSVRFVLSCKIRTTKTFCSAEFTRCVNDVTLFGTCVINLISRSAGFVIRRKKGRENSHCSQLALPAIAIWLARWQASPIEGIRQLAESEKRDGRLRERKWWASSSTSSLTILRQAQ